MGQWITSPERIIQPFQTVNEVTWTFNLLEAMEFVGILCMSMWLTTFFFTPEICKVTQMLVSFITINNRINYQIGPAIWIITTLSLFIFFHGEIYLSISILIWIVLCTTQLFYLSVSVSVSLFLCRTYFFSKWSSLYPRRFRDCSTYSFCGWNYEHIR